MSNHTQDFAARFTVMGDIAETQFETWADGQDLKWDRFGHNRPNSSMTRWNAFLRYMPDYIGSKCFWEVKGCGRDGLLKLKQENLVALRQWSDHLPVHMFVYNSSEDDMVCFPFDAECVAWIGNNCKSDKFHDNDKVYWMIPWQDMVEQTWNPF